MRKCSETLVGLETLVSLSTGLQRSLKWSFESSFGFSNVLYKATIALYHVDNFFEIADDVMRNMSCFACGMECVTSLSVSNVGACRTVIATSVRTAKLILLRGGIRCFCFVSLVLAYKVVL